MTRAFQPIAVGAALSVCMIQLSFTQICPDPVAADFRVVTLANNATQDLFGSGAETGNWYGVVAMDVAPDGKVFIAKMCSGDIMVYTPTETNPAATVRAGTVPTKCNNEDGLLGVAVDPSYPATGWIYAFHTDAASVDFSNVSARNTDTRLHTLTRYTYVHSNAAGSRLTNPKVILRFPRIVDDRPYHAAGGLDITPSGIMVIGTGDDTNPHNGGNHCSQNAGFGPTWYVDPGCDGARTSGNTNDLRGKLLRIKPIAFPDNQTPTPGIGSTYEVPARGL
jgi:cytochrome c